MINAYDVKVKDYPFYAEARTEDNARDIIYLTIQRKCKLFKQYVNIPKEAYVITKRS